MTISLVRYTCQIWKPTERRGISRRPIKGSGGEGEKAEGRIWRTKGKVWRQRSSDRNAFAANIQGGILILYSLLYVSHWDTYSKIFY